MESPQARRPANAQTPDAHTRALAQVVAMNCDNCHREIESFVLGVSTFVDSITSTTIAGVYRGMWCRECRGKAGLDARSPSDMLRAINDKRKRQKRNRH